MFAAIVLLVALPSSATILDTEPTTRTSPIVSSTDSVSIDPSSGAATYQYRLELPPGTGGLTPELALSYNSSSRGSEYGWGWGLNLSSIERSTRYGPPSYEDAEDDFELDGELLVPDPSNPTGRFHKIRSDLSRIQYFPNASPQLSYWEVTKPNGLRLRYGSRQASNSRLTVGPSLTGKTFRWLLDQVIDARGNAYRIDYKVEYDPTGEFDDHVIHVRPERIQYSFREGDAEGLSSTRTQRVVSFEWEPRGYGSSEDVDRPTSLRSGFKIQIAHRLAAIRIGLDSDGNREISPSEQTRAYKLTYHPKLSAENPEWAPFSQLASIQRTGVGDLIFPTKTEFGYTTQPRGFAAAVELTQGTGSGRIPGGAIRRNALEDTVSGLHDLNGDGILDRVRADVTSRLWRVAFGLSEHEGGPGYAPVVLWNWCTASGGSQSCNTTIPAADSPAVVGVSQSTTWTRVHDDLLDMNGDGRPDRVTSAGNGANWSVRLNNGTGFDAARTWEPPSSPSGEPDEATHIDSVRVHNSGPLNRIGHSRMVDVNFDGLPDHLASNTGSTAETLWLSINQGCDSSGACGFADAILYDAELEHNSGTLFFDGMADLGSQTQKTLLLATLADLHGDGVPDVVFEDGSGGSFCLASRTYPRIGHQIGGTRWAAETRQCESSELIENAFKSLTSDFVDTGDPGAGDHYSIQSLIDLNGDGAIDLVFSGRVLTSSGQERRNLYVLFGLGDGRFSKIRILWGDPSPRHNDIRSVRFSNEDGDIDSDIVDVNGDGLPDRLWSSASCQGCTNYYWEMYENPGLGGLLTSVKTEIGGVVSLSLVSSSAFVGRQATAVSTPYAAEALGQDVVPETRHRWVVSSTIEDGGTQSSAPIQRTYAYAEPRYDHVLREGRGFRMVEATDNAGTVARTLFHQDTERRGREEYQEVTTGQVAQSSRQTVWQVLGSQNESGQAVLGSSFVVPQVSTSRLYVGTSEQGRTIRRVFDSVFGNLELETDLGPDGIEGTPDDHRSRSVFAPVDTTSWMLRLPRERWQEFDGASSPKLNHESFTYDEGLIETRTVSRHTPIDGSTQALVETWDHDVYGNATQYWPPSRPTSAIAQIVTTWDPQYSTFPQQITRQDTGISLSTRYAFDPGLGEVAKRLDPLGHLECWGFDGFGRLSERRDRALATTDLATACEATRETFRFSDDELGSELGNPDSQYVSALTYPWASGATALPIETRQYFDGLGRVYREAKRARTSVVDDYLVTTRTWGPRGEPTTESEPVRTCRDPLACPPASSPTHLTQFDALLRPTVRMLRLANGTERAEEYIFYEIRQHDGVQGTELVEIHSVLGAPSGTLTREIGRDPSGEVVSAYESGGGTTVLRRDPSGRIALVDGPDVYIGGSTFDANLLEVEYNSVGQRVALGRPSSLGGLGGGNRTTYSYESDGNLLHVVPARGANFAITNSYDGLGRLRFKDLAPSNSLSSPGPTDVVYQYDTSVFGSFPGQLGRVSTADVQTEVGYDPRGRAIKKRRVIGASSYDTDYAFDLLDRVTATAFPNRTYIAKVFDGSQLASFHDLLTSVQFTAFRNANTTARPPFITGIGTTGIGFHASGGVEHISFINGAVETSQVFDPNDYRLSRTSTANSAGSLEQLDYTYDTAGNLTFLMDSDGRLSELFIYDGLHRLRTAVGWGAYPYASFTAPYEASYDAAGNLLRKGDVTLTYGALGAGPHAATGATGPGGSAVYSYDTDGNVAARAIAATNEFEFFGHDGENRMVMYTYYRSTGGSGNAAYTYDDSGARVSRSAAKTGILSESQHYVDRDYEVDFNRQRTRTHLYIGATRIATLERAISTSSNPPVERELHYHSNHLGTPRLITDQTGAVAQRTFTKPFGEMHKVVDGLGNDLLPSNRASQYLFTGRQADVETSLQYFGARYYDPAIGRFLEQDPALFGPNPGGTFQRIGNTPQSWNAYNYAENRPMRVVDPDGRQSVDAAVVYAHGGGVSPFDGRLHFDPVDALKIHGALAAVLLTGGAAAELGPVAYGWAMMNPELAAVLGYESLELFNPGPPLRPEGAFANSLGDAASGAAREAFSKVLGFTERSLQKGFMKHGADFGLTGNWNPSRAADFSRVVNQHINAAGVQAIEGTWRGANVTHYLDPSSGLNVMVDPAGNFVGGWRLGPGQLQSVMESGRLY